MNNEQQEIKADSGGINSSLHRGLRRILHFRKIPLLWTQYKITTKCKTQVQPMKKQCMRYRKRELTAVWAKTLRFKKVIRGKLKSGFGKISFLPTLGGLKKFLKQV